jgi:hypothetical protein
MGDHTWQKFPQFGSNIVGFTAVAPGTASRTASAGTGQLPVHSNRHKACLPERNGQDGGDQT